MNAQIFTENFDDTGFDLPLGWTEVDPENKISISDDSTLFFDDDFSAKPPAKAITPNINLSSLNNPVLSFERSQDDYDGEVDVLEIYYGNSDSGPWTLIPDAVFDTETNGSFINEVLDLPDKSSNYYLAFQIVYGFNYGIEIDNISIYEKPSYLNRASVKNNKLNIFVSKSDYYTFYIDNIGLNNDIYDIEVLGGAWPYEIQSVNGSSINELAVNASTIDSFFVKTTVLDNAKLGDEEFVDVVITSQSQSNITDTFKIHTVAIDTINSFPYFEDFSDVDIDLPVGWTQDDPSNIIESTWGTLNFRTNFDSEPSSKAISVGFDLSSLDHPACQFQLKLDEAFNETDILKVLYANSASGPWTTIPGAVFYKKTNNEWVQKTIDLPEPSSNYFIAFQIDYNFADGFEIDDLSVYNKKPYEYNVSAISNIIDSKIGGKASFELIISNYGAEQDFYNLSSINGKWNYAILDDSGATIDQININTSGKDTVFVEVTVPENTNIGDYDTTDFIISSQGNPSLSDTLQLITGAFSIVDSFPYLEDFSNIVGDLPPGWMESDFGDNISTFYGTLNFDTDFSISTPSKAITLGFDISSLNTPALKFDYKIDETFGRTDTLKVYYSNDQKGPWQPHSNGKFSGTTLGEWMTADLELPNPTNTYYIAFEIKFTFADGFAIDSLMVYDMSVSNSKPVKPLNNVNVYPNPFAQNLYINHNYSEIQLKIINIHGKSVMQLPLVNTFERIDLSKLSPGIYLLKLNRKGNPLYHKKIIKSAY